MNKTGIKSIRLDIIAISAVVILSLLMIKNDLSKLGELSAKNDRIDREWRAETERRAFLVKYIMGLDNGSKIELIARQKLGLIKSGETPYKVIDKR